MSEWKSGPRSPFHSPPRFPEVVGSRCNKTWSLHSRRIHASSIYDWHRASSAIPVRRRGENWRQRSIINRWNGGCKGAHSREQSGRGGPRNQRARYSRRNYFRKGIARRDLSFDASRAIGRRSTTRFSYPAVRATEIIVQPYFHAIAWIARSALGWLVMLLTRERA